MTRDAADLSTATRWRRDAVRPVLSAFAEYRRVDAVMLSGSTGRGEADRWSDVEVGVFWSSRQSPADREAILSAAGAAYLRLVTDQDAGPPWYDHLYLGAPRPDGLMVEVVHSLTTATQELMDATLQRFNPTLPALDTIKGIVDGSAKLYAGSGTSPGPGGPFGAALV